MGREINQRKAAIIGCGFVGSATALSLIHIQMCIRDSCMGIASGSASAFSEYLATKSEIEAIYKQVRVED